MNRNHLSHSRELVSYTLDQLPWRFYSRIHRIDFLAGVDPCWVGLHQHTSTLDGRLYSETAHVNYGIHDKDTVVLPQLIDFWSLIHEFGHILHRSLDFIEIKGITSQYSETDKYERFAEFFHYYLYPNNFDIDPDRKKIYNDPETIELLNKLSVLN